MTELIDRLAALGYRPLGNEPSGEQNPYAKDFPNCFVQVSDVDCNAPENTDTVLYVAVYDAASGGDAVGTDLLPEGKAYAVGAELWYALLLAQEFAQGYGGAP
jgi:hypothetical protein